MFRISIGYCNCPDELSLLEQPQYYVQEVESTSLVVNMIGATFPSQLFLGFLVSVYTLLLHYVMMAFPIFV